MSNYPAPPASGLELAWTDQHGALASTARVRWDNEGWTVETDLVNDRAVVVLRLTALWSLRQVLLFRDMAEPDLWLGTDGRGRWGEVNGAHRSDLDGCSDVVVAGSPIFNSIVLRRLPLEVGHGADMHEMLVDVESLSITPRISRYVRHDDRRWAYDSPNQSAIGITDTVNVDAHGFVIDEPPRFFRQDHSL